MRKQIFISLAVAVMLITLIAAPAMAVEDTKTATVTVKEFISFTVTDYGDAGINFGNLDPGTNDNAEAAQAPTTGAIKLTVGAETNANCNIQIKGSGDFSDGGTNTFALSNAKWDKDNVVTGATTMTITYATVDTSTKGVEKNVDVWHWVSIPSGQYATTYTTTFYYQAIKQ